MPTPPLYPNATVLSTQSPFSSCPGDSATSSSTYFPASPVASVENPAQGVVVVMSPSNICFSLRRLVESKRSIRTPEKAARICNFRVADVVCEDGRTLGRVQCVRCIPSHRACILLVMTRLSFSIVSIITAHRDNIQTCCNSCGFSSSSFAPTRTRCAPLT